MKLWVALLVPTVSLVLVLLATSPTTASGHRCGRSAIEIGLTPGYTDGENDQRLPAGEASSCVAAARGHLAFVGGVAAIGGLASFVAYKRRGIAAPNTPTPPTDHGR